MAIVEGTQSIPAELLDEYRGNLTEKMPNAIIRKRYPYHVPQMQEGGSRVHPEQIIQRTRWKEGVKRFKAISTAQRQRWYASMPPWGSLLWYYNYYMLCAIKGVLGAIPEGINNIKSRQVITGTATRTDNTYTFPTKVNPDLSMVLINGAGMDALFISIWPSEYWFAWGRQLVLKSFFSSSMILLHDSQVPTTAVFSAEIIEYI